MINSATVKRNGQLVECWLIGEIDPDASSVWVSLKSDVDHDCHAEKSDIVEYYYETR